MVRRNRKKCVAIARDVLLQLRRGRFEATSGVYVAVGSKTISESLYRSDGSYESLMGSSFQELFKKDKSTTCEVCALGAAFASLVNIENRCSVENMHDADDMFKRLEKYFGSYNMTLMESAFEGCRTFHSDPEYDPRAPSYEMMDIAIEWGKRFYSNKQCLRAIMMNIIRNNGDFQLPKKDIARAKALEKEAALEEALW